MSRVGPYLSLVLAILLAVAGQAHAERVMTGPEGRPVICAAQALAPIPGDPESRCPDCVPNAITAGPAKMPGPAPLLLLAHRAGPPQTHLVAIAPRVEVRPRGPPRPRHVTA